MSSTQPQAPSAVPASPRAARWRLGALCAAAVAAVATVAVLAGTEPTIGAALASDEAIAIAQGISVTPAPGWTLGNRGPNWVALNNPDTKPLQGANFQQEASINYTANVVHPQGTIPVIGTFTELLNPSNGHSAFIDFRQDSSATTQAAGDGGMMISSLE